jgi:excisionase family DNA binding protein
MRTRRVDGSRLDATGRGVEVGAMSTMGQDGPLGEVRFLTVAEVASAMRVSKMTVYRLVHAGTLPAVQVGRSFRIPEQAVSDYLRDSFVQAG